MVYLRHRPCPPFPYPPTQMKNYGFKVGKCMRGRGAFSSERPEFTPSVSRFPVEPTTVLPDSCCYHRPEAVASPFRRDYWPALTTTTAVWTTVQAVEHENMEQMPYKCRLPSYRYYYPGCERSLIAWIRRSADVLFVLGYCVISFLKLCFLGILR